MSEISRGGGEVGKKNVPGSLGCSIPSQQEKRGRKQKQNKRKVKKKARQKEWKKTAKELLKPLHLSESRMMLNTEPWLIISSL